VVKEQIETYQATPMEIIRIKGLILNDKNSHKCVIQKSENHYPSAAKSLGSPMTHFLHEQFGLEFKYFIGNNQNIPYGYAIIDHANKTIYKGGDVMSLRQLIGRSDDKKSNVQIENESQRTKVRENEGTKSSNHAESSRDMANLFDSLVKSLEYQMEQDLMLIENNCKRKKKREKWQRR
jgi:hypothetical protein